MKREPGYYWIVIKNRDPEIALFDGELWTITGAEVDVPQDNIAYCALEPIEFPGIDWKGINDLKGLERLK